MVNKGPDKAIVSFAALNWLLRTAQVWRQAKNLKLGYS